MHKKTKPPKRAVDEPKVPPAEQSDRRQHDANRTARRTDKRRSHEQDNNTGIAGVQRPPADS